MAVSETGGVDPVTKEVEGFMADARKAREAPPVFRGIHIRTCDGALRDRGCFPRAAPI